MPMRRARNDVQYGVASVPSLDASAEPIAAQVTVAVDRALGHAYSVRGIGVDVAAPAALSDWEGRAPTKTYLKPLAL